MSVLKQLEDDLRGLPSAIRSSTLAEAARALAGAIDGSESLRDLSAAVKELRATMEALEAKAGQVPSEADPLDRLESAGPSNVLGFRSRGGSRKTS